MKLYISRSDLMAYTLIVGDNCTLGNLIINACDEAVIVIGDGVGFVSETKIFMPEPSRLTIGYGCLFASETMIFTSDFHSIILRWT